MGADFRAMKKISFAGASNNWTFVPVIPAEPFYFYRFYEQRAHRTEN